MAIITVDTGAAVSSTNFHTIQAAVNAAASGDTVQVAAGTYNENVTISKPLTLVSTAGAGSTTIVGQGSTALGAILVTSNVNNVTIGGIGAGFTVVGIDNASPGVESAAIYLQGAHDGLIIRGNNVVANGDAGLMSEFGYAITNTLIDSNEFSGQTFAGTSPGGTGFTFQFTTPNVPRQLVVLGGNNSTTDPSTPGVTFTNNAITGTAGGINGSGAQGNTLVTIDVANSSITGNVFTGFTNLFGAQLRAREENTTISGNSFSSPLGGNVGIFAAVSGTETLGTISSNTLSGGTGNDTLVGTSGNDILAGGDGSDSIRGQGGADTIDGGAGEDTAYFNGSRAGYTISRTATGYTITDTNPGNGDDGTDTISNVENIAFSDATIDLSAPLITSGTFSGTTAERADSNDAAESATPFGALTGDIAFADLEVGDIHSIGVSNGTATRPANLGTGFVGVFSAGLSDPATGDGSGTVTWSYSVTNPAHMTIIDQLSAGESIVQTYSVSIDDGTGNVTTQVVTVTIQGTNDAPLVNVAGPGFDVTGALSEAAAQTGVATPALATSGLITFTDTDVNDIGHAAAEPATVGLSGFTAGAPSDATLLSYFSLGTPGKAAGSQSGSVTWEFSAPDSAFDYLPAGETLTLTYNVTVSDGDGGSFIQPVSITITGANDIPVGNDDSASATENGVQTYVVLANDTDADNGAALTIASLGTVTVTSANGSVDGINAASAFSIVDNQIQFTPGTLFDALDVDDTATITVVYTVTDQNGATDTATLTLSMSGANDVPMIVAEAATPTILDTGSNDTFADVTGTLVDNWSDSDLGDSRTFALATGENGIGTYGTLTVNGDGTYTFVADAAAINALQSGSFTDVFDVQVTDGQGAVATTTLTVNITAGNDTPVITAEVATPTLVDTSAADTFSNITGQLDATDRDTGAALTYSLTSPAGGSYGTLTVNPNGSYSYVANAAAINALQSGSYTDVFNVQVSDGQGGTASTTLTINISADNDAPTLSAEAAGTLTDTVIADTFADLTGTLDGGDIDTGATSTFGLAAGEDGVGSYGTLTVNTNGSYTFVANAAAINALPQGGSTSETFQVQVSDGLAPPVVQTLTIDITAANDAPIITGGVTSGSVSETIGIAGIRNAGPAGGLEPDPSLLTPAITAALVSLVTTPDAANFATQYGVILSALGNNQTQTIAVIWDFLDDNYNNYYNLSVNEAFVRLGMQYAQYLESGGLPFYDVIAKYTADGVDVGTDPDRQQSMHDNLLGNLDAVTLQDRFATLAPSLYSALVAAIDAIDPDLHNRPVFGGYEGTNIAPSRAFDQAEGYAPVASGALTFADADSGDTPEASVSTAAATITYTPSGGPATTPPAGLDLAAIRAAFSVTSGGAWTYNAFGLDLGVLGQGDTLVLSYTVTVTDDQGATDDQVVTITINGTNDAPIVSGAVTDSVDEDEASSFTLDLLANASDVDAGYELDVASVSTAVTSGTWAPAITTTVNAETGQLSLDPAQFNALGASETIQITFSYNVVDEHGAATPTTAVVTVTGSNDAPVISSGPGTGSAIESVGTASGTITFADPDRTDTPTASASTAEGAVAVVYTPSGGSATTPPAGLGMTAIRDAFSITSGGAWTYDASAAGSALDALAAGDTLALTYTITVTDGRTPPLTDTETVTITITGTNDAAIVTGDVAGSVTEASGVLNGTVGTSPATGNLDHTDVDNDDDVFSTTVVTQGTYGTLSIDAAGGWSYALAEGNALVQALNVGQTLTDTVTVATGDGTLQNISITINGANDAAVVTGTTSATVQESGGTANGTAGTSPATGNLDHTDVDNPNDVWSTTVVDNGDYGTLTIDAAGAWSYALNESNASVQALLGTATLSDTITVATADGTEQVITITITAQNDAPTVSAAANLGAASDIETVDGDGATLLTNAADIDSGDDLDVVVSGLTATVTFTGGAEYATLGYASQGALEAALTAAVQAAVVAETGAISLPASFFQMLDATQGANVVLSYQVEDLAHATVAQTASFAVTGTNQAPFITVGAGLTASIAEEGTLTGSGTVTFDDYEQSQTHSVSVGAIAGGERTYNSVTTAHNPGSYYGTFSSGFVQDSTGHNTLGEIAWNFAVNNAAINGLAAGEVVTQVYRVTVTDNGTPPRALTQNVTVTITGTNDAPVITSSLDNNGFTEAVEPDASAPAFSHSGTITFTDADLNDVGHTATVSVAASGTLGGISATDDAALLSYLTITDSDSGSAGIQVVKAAGSTSGSAAWTFNAPDSAFDYLAAGETVTFVYTVTINDGDSGTDSEQQISVTVTGSNDAPVITVADLTGGVTEANSSAALTDSGTISFGDVDLSDTHMASAVYSSSTHGSQLGTLTASVTTDTTGGTGGVVTWNFSVNDAAVQFLGAGQSIAETYTITLTDSETGGTITRDVVVTITGSNDTPTITAEAAGTLTDTAGVDTFANLTGSLDGADVDNGHTLTYSIVGQAIASGQTSVGGNYGTLTLQSNGSYTFAANPAAINALPAGGSTTQQFQVQVADEHGLTATTTLTVQIVAANDTPIATGETLAGTNEDTPITYAASALLGNDTDAEGTALSIAGVTSGTGGTAVLNGDGSVTFTPTANYNGTATFSYTVTDGSATSTTVTATLNVGAVPDADTVVTNATLNADSLQTNGTLFMGTGNPGSGFVIVTDAVDAPGVEIGITAVLRYQGTAALDPRDSSGHTYVVAAGAAGGTANENATAGDDGWARWNYTISINADTDNNGGTIGTLDYRITVYSVGAGGATAQLLTYTMDEYIAAVRAALGDATANAIQNASLYQDSFNFEYVPGLLETFDPTAPGTYRVEVAALDPGNASTLASTHIDIVVNSRPVATADTLGATEDTGVTFTAAQLLGNDTDADGNTLTIASVTAINGGSVVLNTNGTVTFTPDLNFNGPAQFSYTVTDGLPYTDGVNASVGQSAPAIVTVNVAAVNDPAVITGTDAGNVVEAGGVANGTPGTPTATGDLLATDVDNTADAFQAVVTATASTGGYGTYTVTAAGVWTYTLDNTNATVQALAAGAPLTDTFTVLSEDGTPHTVTVNITGSNDAAVVSAAVVALTEANAALSTSGALTNSDVDNDDTFVPQSGTPGTNGTFSIDTAGNWTYTANSAFDNLNVGDSVSDTFTVAAADGTTTTVQVTINGSNDAPTLSAEVAGTLVDTAATDAFANLTGTLDGADVDDGHTLTYSIVGQTIASGQTSATSAYGTLTLLTDGSYTFVANAAAINALPAGAPTSQTFQVQVADEHGATATQTVTIDITPANDAPVASDDARGATEGSLVSFNVITGSDSDAEGNQITVTSILDIDDAGGLATAQSDTVASSNPGEITTDWGAQIILQSDGLIFYDLTSPSAVFNALAAGQIATDTVTYTVSDGQGGTDTATITFTITGTNDPIAGVADVVTATENGSGLSGNVLANDTDVDTDDTKTVVGVTPGSNATVQSVVGGYTVTLPEGIVITISSNGTYSVLAPDALDLGDTITGSFQYTVQDGGGSTSFANVTVTVTGSNDTPIATVGADATVNENDATPLAISLIEGVTDADAAAVLSVSGVTQSSGRDLGGAFTVTGTTLSFDPNLFTDLVAGASENITFTYTVSDQNGASVTQTLTVTVTGTNDVATIAGIAVGSATEETVLTTGGTLTIADADAGQAELVPIAAGTAGTGGFGTFAVAANGVWSYALNNAHASVQALPAGATLTDTITVSSEDGTDTQVITVTIHGTNDGATIAGTVAGGVTEETSLTVGGTLTITDADTGQAEVQAITSAGDNGYGTFAVTAAGAWTYTLDNAHASVQALPAGGTLTDTITVTSEDGTDTEVITVTVTGTNDGATITGTTTGGVTEETSLTATGTLSVSDIDSGESEVQPIAAGTDGDNGFGTFAVTAAGEWTYTLDHAHASVQALPAGETLTDSITVTSEDGTDTQVITVTITGTNDGATIAGDISAPTDEDSAVAVGGTLTVTDIDTGEAAVQPIAAGTAGTNGFGTFAVTAAGVWTYTLNPAAPGVQALADGQSLTDSISATSADGTDTQVITVTITGTNDAPVVTGAVSTAANEDSGTVSMDLLANASDLESQTLTVTEPMVTSMSINGVPIDLPPGGIPASALGATLTGSTLSLDTNNPDIDLTLGQTAVITISYNVEDTQGGSTPTTATLTLTGVNDTPVALGGTADVTEDALANGQVLGTDQDLGETETLTFALVGASPAGFTLNSDGSYAFDAASYDHIPLGGTEVLTLAYTVTDAQGATSAPADLVVTINGTNDGAVIGGVASGNAVEDTTLTASGTLTINDVDDGEAVLVAVPAGTPGSNGYGSFEVGTDGAWTYTLTNGLGTVQALPAGATLTDSITVTSEDGTASETITVTITGTNDGAFISAVGATGAVTEDGPLTVGGALTIEDVDTGEAAVVPVTAGTPGAHGFGTFEVNANGTWTYTLDNTNATVQGLSAGVTLLDLITVQSVDGTGEITIEVTINGTNDGVTLSVDADPAADLVNENATGLVGIGALATDPDATNNTVTYALVASAAGGAYSGPFAIDANNGEVSLTTALDAETSGASVTIYVEATSSDGTSTITPFTVTVGDVDEFDVSAPADTNAAANTIAEGATGAVGITANATDDDASTNAVTYQLVASAGGGAYSGPFAIDAGTGVVTLTSALDHEATGGSVTIYVQATSSDGSTAITEFSVAVTNANEAPTGLTPASASVNEYAANSTVVATLGAVDPDASDSFTFTLLDSADGRFAIVGNEVRVANHILLDYEQATTHTIRVRVTDQGGISFEQDIVVNLNDVNPENVVGTSANNTIVGGSGNDRLNGGGGTDTLIGGLGNDTYDLDRATDIVIENAGEGTDIVTGNGTFDLDVANYANVENGILYGTGNRAIYGTSIVNFLYGNSGNNTLDGRAGGDRMYGGSGADTYIVDHADDRTIEAVGNTGGPDLVLASVTHSLGQFVENLTLTGTDAINGNGNTLDNVITGNDQANTLNGVGGNDTLIGGLGNDTLLGGDGIDILDGGDGDDVFSGGAGADAMTGGTGVDRASYSTQTSDLTVYLTGVASVGGEAAGDTLSGIENATLGAGNDTLYGNDDANLVDGLAGNDTLHGAGGADTLRGGDGNDTFFGGAGADNMQGGAGVDSVSYSDQTANLNINLNGTAATGGDATGDVLTTIENVTGGSGNDTITGNSDANLLEGLGGADTLLGGGGNDTLVGGEGNDVFVGGLGADNMIGGSGVDRVTYSTQTVDLVIHLDGTASVGGEAAGDTLNTIENVTAGSGNDTVYGSSDANLLEGLGGNDTLIGAGGSDILRGGDGNDILDGGEGGDSLTGGLGDDGFVFADNWGIDSIADFDAADTEYIDLSAVTGITDFADLVANHAREAASGLEIYDGANVIRITGFHLTDLGTGQALSENDFRFV